MQDPYFGQKFHKVALRNCCEMSKSITNWVPQPKIWVDSKTFCLHFFLKTLLKKGMTCISSSEQYFRSYQFFHNLKITKHNFCPFSTKKSIFSKSVGLSPKFKTVTSMKSKKYWLWSFFFCQKPQILKPSRFLGPDFSVFGT